LAGQLAWDGARYGAYFAVHAGKGSSMPGEWSDQLSYVDDQGKLLSGGWGSGCSHDEGLRLLAEPGAPFSAACRSDGTPQPGLNWMTDTGGQRLAFEEAWDGYTAGRLGSIMRAADGSHLLVWASRGDGGVDADAGTSHARAKDSPDVAMVRVVAGGAPA